MAESTCTFTAGDLYCVDDDCANSDHRPRPAGYTPGNWARIAKMRLRLRLRRRRPTR